MIVAKCEECGYAEQVPDTWAGRVLECPCGNAVQVPSRFKIKLGAASFSRKLVSARTSNRISSLAQDGMKKSTYSRSDFIWRMLLSIGLCFASFMATSTSPQWLALHMALVVPLVGTWQCWMTNKRIQDFNGHPANVVPAVALTVLYCLPLSRVLLPMLGMELLGFMTLALGVWHFVVFIRCLAEPTRHESRGM